ncbi:MAG TPA: hypothetical protein VI942_08450 [Thermoanaerobaculia bacterium]|nr:hypothetical protein [Thermoanaerobaculia bacterium]
MSWRAFDPSPFRCWLRWAPRSWPAAERPYLDLAAQRIVWPGEGGTAVPEELPAGEPDVVYLPPVESAGEELRDDLARRLDDDGQEVAMQLFPGQADRGGWATIQVLDPLGSLLGGGPVAPREPFVRERGESAELVVAVPLIPGLFPAAASIERLLDEVAELRPAAVLGVTPELSPLDRRRLVGALGDAAFEAVFHGAALEESELARRAAARRIGVLPERPLVMSLPPRVSRNREVATQLAECGELWLRLGRSESEGVGLLAAARRVEQISLDISALAREGNLAVLDFLSPAGKRVVEEASEGDPGLVAELRSAWLGGSAE